VPPRRRPTPRLRHQSQALAPPDRRPRPPSTPDRSVAHTLPRAGALVTGGPHRRAEDPAERRSGRRPSPPLPATRHRPKRPALHPRGRSADRSCSAIAVSQPPVEERKSWNWTPGCRPERSRRPGRQRRSLLDECASCGRQSTAGCSRSLRRQSDRKPDDAEPSEAIVHGGAHRRPAAGPALRPGGVTVTAQR